jgi:putative acetyltransferase
LRIVPFEDAHAGAVVALIGEIFGEYGMTFEPAGFDADLTAIGARYSGAGGWFAVLVDDGRVVGTVGVVPREAGRCELKRLYLRPEYRGHGHGEALVNAALAWAAHRGFRDMVAWSDVRLPRAHRLYERLGFDRFGARTVDDADRSHEHGFLKTIPARN